MVGDLADLHEKITPLFTVITEQAAFLALLRDCKICERICVLAVLEIAEVGIGKELTFLSRIIRKFLSCEDILLV